MTTLPTFSPLPIVSPLKLETSSLAPDQQGQAARAAVGLGEIADRALLHIRGSGDDAQALMHGIELKIGDVKVKPSGIQARLRRDEFVQLTSDLPALLANFTAEIGDHRVTLTDITHGRCVLLLAGKDAPRVLPKICALDFGDAQFPNLHAAQTSLAKVRTLIIRADIDATPAYALIVDRSLAAYVWRVVADAASEFTGLALSKDGLNALRIGSLW